SHVLDTVTHRCRCDVCAVRFADLCIPPVQWSNSVGKTTDVAQRDRDLCAFWHCCRAAFGGNHFQRISFQCSLGNRRVPHRYFHHRCIICAPSRGTACRELGECNLNFRCWVSPFLHTLSFQLNHPVVHRPHVIQCNVVRIIRRKLSRSEIREV